LIKQGETMSNMPRPIIVGLGEILWDVFPDGAHFGGAPANFACSAAELCGAEMDVYVAGSVGRDDLGQQAIELLLGRGVDTSCVSLVDQPTGQVLVELDEAGRASFKIVADTAWDNLAPSNELQQLAAHADVVCFGTLGQRSELSRRTIQSFVRATRPDCLRILDINLRPPFWNEEIVLQSFELANMLKLNDSELAVVADVLGWSGAVDELLEMLIESCEFQLVALTRGREGAVLKTASGQHSDLPGQPAVVIDTVGAGDAYTAVLAIGTLSGLPLDTINAWGNRVAAFVCSQPGATPRLPDNLHHP
jgi:fructokinase